MYDAHNTHPLLAQLPLTVSPFISLPSAVTLPYTYKNVPASLPPTVLAEPGDGSKPKYVTSASGHAAHPDDIIASCRALQEHIRKQREESEKAVREWEEGIKERELAEKRRVAPGWLDRDEKILEPTRKPPQGASLLDGGTLGDQEGKHLPVMKASKEGEELDRAFGGLNVK